jgi:hypothetical protein
MSVHTCTFTREPNWVCWELVQVRGEKGGGQVVDSDLWGDTWELSTRQHVVVGGGRNKLRG